MNILVVFPQHNSPGKRDVTGAFRPEALRFKKHAEATHGASVDVASFDNRAGKLRRRRQVEALLRATPQPLDMVAFFCHGLAKSIQTGHDLGTVATLAEALAETAQDRDVDVVLYACDAADTHTGGPGGDGGFADALRDALAERGVSGRVDAHVTTGHTTKNPYVRRFWSNGEAAGTGGDWLVAPGSPKWASWRKALRDPRLPLRYDFPFRDEVF